ncbi:Crp/Fnr family transcriptional regulator [Novosphingobium aerophilum]|uniref:Crp/Fnr family transcriptional regulator n=1 Tax=Novosphingobium TaxID=165696 RepID=UPI0006C8C664|nr:MULTISPECIES: Crp/Fnr family transcriptional regulator [unclassified Novosphingobium]KPH60876.1 Crp/Fnr family transcriptional regulator [Novosphingobium sp. ST904]TCM38409.1 CRP-like cAMP-binding protein [Novosphingobium sp. ST904]WRT92577.1 Crp/Fnr family transcriptional regulator [Novosphingobium sp. RL4]
MELQTSQEQSDLLAALRPADFALLQPHLAEVRMKSGEVIYQPGDAVEYCYLPRGASVCSFFVELDSGIAVETILVGREGALGGVVSQGSLPAYARANVLHGGLFWRIPTRQLDEAKRQSPVIGNLFSRYADCMMAQVFQSIACNAVHTIEQRAAKWLGAAVDRIGRNDVTMTQEQLASMMGIGRSYASRVLQRFKREGLVRTRRGGIAVSDRESLRSKACSCNDHVAAHFNKVLGGVYPSAD